MLPRLHSVLLPAPDAAACVAFFHLLGFASSSPVSASGWARLSSDALSTPLIVQAWPGRPPPPLLQFSLPADELDVLLPRLLAAGGSLSGAVQRGAAGTLATLRAPLAAGGHAFTLREEEPPLV